MNIYALEGHKVVCETFEAGYDHQKAVAEKHLKVGNEYTVQRTEVGEWHTDVYLKEFPEVAFNSVFFVDTLEPDTIDDPNKQVFTGCEITLADVLERPTGIEITANDFMLIELSLESHINTLQNRFINEEQFIHPAKKYEGVLDKIKALNELPENTFLLSKKSDTNGRNKQ